MNEGLDTQSLCRKAERLLHTEKQVTVNVLKGLVKDENYRAYLKMCRHTPSYLEHLLDHPPDSSQILEQAATLERAEQILDQWEALFRRDEMREAYDRKYRRFFPSKESGECKSCTEPLLDEFREVYLDANATTMVRPEIARWLAEFYGGTESDANPGSDYVQGRYAKNLIEQARGRVAEVLHTHRENIIFTSSGSEANNLAIKGVAFAHMQDKGHLITSTVEHPSVLETMKYLESLGFEVTWIKPGGDGAVNPRDIESSIRSNTLLVSVMTANNEVGTINPVGEIGAVCKRHQIPLMSDGVQAFGKMELEPEKSGISLFTFSGHKIYGPKGAGGLYIAPGVRLIPQIHGGGQEGGLRSSTENTAAIAALGQAAMAAAREMEVESKRVGALRDYFLEELRKFDDRVILYGSMADRIYSNLCLGFYRVNGQALKKSLNRAGICVSTGSACSSRKKGPSHVLTEMGADVENYGMIRIGMGLETTKEELDYVLKYLRKLLPSLRKTGR